LSNSHSDVFVISDTHFGHANMCKFVFPDGSKVRPFNSVKEMDEAMIEKWNSTVKPKDKVYHLGDVAIPRKSLALLERLHGKKVLIRGNHDIFKLEDYAKYFKDIRAFHVLNGCIFTHAPLHPMSLEKFGCNIHGHTHTNIVKKPSEIGGMERDQSYLNVCVEYTDYAPLPLDEVFGRVIRQGGRIGFLEKRRNYVQDMLGEDVIG
jgi:calcineurin-like phosphoesterase family protein